MLEAISVPTLLRSPRYVGGAWLDKGRHWSRADLVGLHAAIKENAEPEKVADALGRPPQTLAFYAYDTGLKLPTRWRSLVVSKKLNSGPRQELQYPFIVKVRGEHSELLMVNSLVPRGLPEQLRADVCQEIMLAVWQKDVSIVELMADKALVNKFIRGVRSSNYEGNGYAMSLDVPMQDGRSWYDVLPDPATMDYN